MSNQAEELNDCDVYTLIGDAAFRHMKGETDMPDYFFGLAARIALVIKDSALADRVKEIQKEFKESEASST